MFGNAALVVVRFVALPTVAERRICLLAVTSARLVLVPVLQYAPLDAVHACVAQTVVEPCLGRPGFPVETSSPES